MKIKTECFENRCSKDLEKEREGHQACKGVKEEERRSAANGRRESGTECEEEQSARKDSVELPAAMALSQRTVKEEESRVECEEEQKGGERRSGA